MYQYVKLEGHTIRLKSLQSNGWVIVEEIKTTTGDIWVKLVERQR